MNQKREADLFRQAAQAARDAAREAARCAVAEAVREASCEASFRARARPPNGLDCDEDEDRGQRRLLESTLGVHERALGELETKLDRLASFSQQRLDALDAALATSALAAATKDDDARRLSPERATATDARLGVLLETAFAQQAPRRLSQQQKPQTRTLLVGDRSQKCQYVSQEGGYTSRARRAAR